MRDARARVQRFRLAAASLTALAAATVSAGQPSRTPPCATKVPDDRARIVRYGPGRELCRLENSEIQESSGLACGRVNPGVLWTQNDSGGGPVLYAFDTEGRDIGTFRVKGARARDWEDIASFTAGGRGYLLIADTGDNAARRDQCTIYVVEEPRIGRPGVKEPPVGPEAGGTASRDAGMSGKCIGSLRIAQEIRFKYEDGPHDCESVAIDAAARTIYLVSKIVGISCTVYALPVPKPETSGLSVAKPVAVIGVPAATAADMSPDGLRAVVLTYGNAFEYVRAREETWAEAFSRPPRMIEMPARAQGEAICYGPDGKTLYLTSEVGKGETARCPLFEVPVAE